MTPGPGGTRTLAGVGARSSALGRRGVVAGAGDHRPGAQVSLVQRRDRVADAEAAERPVVEASGDGGQAADAVALLAEQRSSQQPRDVARVAPRLVHDVEVVIEHVAGLVVVLPRWQ